jgi:hypothetical protein
MGIVTSNSGGNFPKMLNPTFVDSHTKTHPSTPSTISTRGQLRQDETKYISSGTFVVD